ECIWIQDGVNLATYILGSKNLFQKNIGKTSTGLTVWDPLHKHVVLPDKRSKRKARLEKQARRPPNAFILYRKDKHPELKKLYPEIHNNEISVMAGSMWKSETQETRDKYHAKAMTIKKAFLSEMPNYKYTPRKPDEIQRR
ncbi:high mobility group box domain-containing protein, partial [Podospora aff. communis PSN243]